MSAAAISSTNESMEKECLKTMTGKRRLTLELLGKLCKLGKLDSTDLIEPDPVAVSFVGGDVNVLLDASDVYVSALFDASSVHAPATGRYGGACSKTSRRQESSADLHLQASGHTSHPFILFIYTSLYAHTCESM